MFSCDVLIKNCLKLFKYTCLIDEETRNFLNCHELYLQPPYYRITNHHIIKFYHVFGIPSTPRTFNPLPSAQYVSANIEWDIVRGVASCPLLCTCYLLPKKGVEDHKNWAKKENEKTTTTTTENWEQKAKTVELPKWLLMQTKTMFFYQLKAIGVLYIKSLVHSNPYFRFFQGPKCMLTLWWVLHLFSFRFLLLFCFFLFLALDVWDFKTKSLFYFCVLNYLFS